MDPTELSPDPATARHLRTTAAHHHRLAVAAELLGDWVAAEDAHADAQAASLLATLFDTA